MIYEKIIGTRTKLRILTCLTQFQNGLTRNKIAKIINLNHRNVYEQITDLEFLGIVKEENKNYKLNQHHYLYDSLDNFLRLGEYYENSIISKLYDHSFFHEKFTSHYYIGGYSAANLLVTLYDYFLDLIHIGIEKDYYHTALKQLKVFDSMEDISVGKYVPGSLSIVLYPVDEIPSDVQSISNCYYASNTRGIVECFQHPEGIMEYGLALLLLQSADEGVLNFDLINDELENENLPINLRYVLALLSRKEEKAQHGIKEFTFELKNEYLENIETSLGTELSSHFQHAVNEAIRTVTGYQP